MTWRPATITSAPVNFRATPRIEANNLLWSGVPTGTRIDIDESSGVAESGGTWYPVRIKDQQGYMRKPPLTYRLDEPVIPEVPDGSITSPFLSRDEIQQLIELETAESAALRSELEAVERLRLTAVQLADVVTRRLDVLEKKIELLKQTVE